MPKMRVGPSISMPNTETRLRADAMCSSKSRNKFSSESNNDTNISKLCKVCQEE